MKKKLIFITEALWIGGIETALVNLLNRLDYNRFDVTCLVLRDSLDVADRITPQCRLIVSDRQHKVTFPKGYGCKRLYNIMEEPQNAAKFRRFIWSALRAVFRAAEAKCYALYVKKQLKGEHFDTAVIYSDRAAETAVRAVSADRFLMFYHHGAMRREYHDAYGYRKADKVIAVSPALAEKLRAYRSKYAGKIISVNNIIDIDGVREKGLDIPTVKFSADCFNIVSCGRLSHAKGMDIAVDACAKLVADGFTGFHWYIVGGGPEESALREQIMRLGLEDCVSLLGMQSNPYPYISCADLYVQPSRFEAFGLTIREAQVLAVPVLSTRTDGSAELISDGETGLLCESDADSIAAAIIRLYNAPKLRESIQAELQNHDFERDNSAILNQLYSLL